LGLRDKGLVFACAFPHGAWNDVAAGDWLLVIVWVVTGELVRIGADIPPCQE